jgi:hypothetical protein
MAVVDLPPTPWTLLPPEGRGEGGVAETTRPPRLPPACHLLHPRPRASPLESCTSISPPPSDHQRGVGGAQREEVVPRRPLLPPPCHPRAAAAPLPKVGRCSRRQIWLPNTAVPRPSWRLPPLTSARAPPRKPSAHQPQSPLHVCAGSPAASASAVVEPMLHVELPTAVEPHES